MIKLTRAEVLKIAEISQLELQEQELATITLQLEGVLSYAQRVKEIAAGTQSEPVSPRVNVWRDDLVKPTATEPILAQAPQTLEQYFVVPTVIDNN